MTVNTTDFNEWVSRVGEWRDTTSTVPLLVRDEIIKSKLEPGKPKAGPRSLMFDPLSIQFAMGYKDRRYSLTYDVLKRIPQQLSLIAAIIQTRCNQVASFAVPFRMSKSLGFAVRHKNPARLTTKGEREFIQSMEAFIYNCGAKDPNPHSPVVRDDFETFLKKIVRDSLSYDQITFEIVPDRRGLPYEFMAVDASTIRLAANNIDLDYATALRHNMQYQLGQWPQSITPNAMFTGAGGPYRTLQVRNPELEDVPSYIQLVNGIVRNTYTRGELAFGVRNPRTDIYIQGYGYSELEQLITIITAHLFAEEYNRRFFCITEDSDITTDLGVKPIKDLVGLQFKIWNGFDWRPATAHKTNERPVLKLTTNHGLEIKTSPEHWFLTLDTAGNEKWVQRNELSLGDCLLVDATSLDFPLNQTEFKVGQKYTSPVSWGKEFTPTQEMVEDPEFWEMIGFALGDGHWGNTSGLFQIFPHNSKDLEVFELIHRVSNRHNLDFYEHTVNKHHKYPSSLVAQGIVTFRKQCKSFLNWLYDLGFSKSADARCIPTSIKSAPLFIRRAILRGLFSADGHTQRHKSGYKTPSVHSANDSFKQDIMKTLLSVGVTSNIVGDNVYTQNVEDFTNEIGYIQTYKNEGISRTNKSKSKYDVVHRPLAIKLAKSIQTSDAWTTLPYSIKQHIGKVARNVCGVSNPVLVNWLNLAKIEIPNSLKYHHAHVLELDLENPELVQMYDIEVFDDDHIFLANNLAVHNTQGSAPKGILNFRGDNLTPDQLEAFKRQWRANLEGVENCLDGSTHVYTKEHGFSTLADICGEKEEVPVHIWTGTSWETGLVYKTKEPKILCHTTLDNGSTLSTSPDHKIRVIGNSGEPEWRIQSELQIGDVCLVNKQDTSAETELMCLGKKVTPEFMETLGWLLGDGNIDTRHVSWYYHHDKEQEILSQHLSVIQQYFPKAVKKTHVRTAEEIDDIKLRYGFKSVASHTTKIALNDATAAKWLASHGFVQYGKKCIPAYLYTMPAVHRAAYLRGVFSADGNNAKLRNPAITICNSLIRNQVKHLLLTLGIRTTLSEGKSRLEISSTKRRYVEKASLLRVKDRDAFFALVGFLQPHKQPVALNKLNEANKLDKVPTSTVRKYLGLCREANTTSKFQLLSRRERMDMNSILSGQDGCSRPRLLRYLSSCNIEAPAWMTSFNTASVASTHNTGIYVPMYDVSVNHDDHAFVGENVYSRNSWRTPIMQSEQGVDWIDLHPSNQEMEYSQWIEYLIKVTCYSKSAKVLGNFGTKTIDKVIPGDAIYTHTGKLKKVKNVQITDYCGPMVHLRYGGSTVDVTPEHPVQVSPCTFSYSLIDGTRQRVRHFGSPVWKKAGDLDRKIDYLLVPKETYRQKAPEVTHIVLSDYVTSAVKTDTVSNTMRMSRKFAHNTTSITDQLPLTEDVAFGLGLYVAQGNATDHQVVFTFGAKDDYLVATVQKFADALNVSCSPYKAKDTTANVRISSKLIAEALTSLCGPGALHKRVPQEIMAASPAIQRAFFNGVFSGDGSCPSFKNRSVVATLSSVSDTLIEQLRTLLFAQGIFSYKYENLISAGGFATQNTQQRLDINGVYAARLAEWLTGPRGDKLRARVKASKGIKTHIFEDKDYFYVPITKMHKSEFSGPVYNLEVEDDNSYQVNRTATHNCAVFLIDPAELNFDMHGGVQQTPLFESSQEWKLKASRDRGLKPMLRFIAKMINDQIVHKLDDHFTFDFLGLDELTEQEKLEVNKEKLASYMTMNEIRRADDLPDVEDGDIVMNPTYTTYIQQKRTAELSEKQMTAASGVGAAPTGGGEGAPAQGGEEGKTEQSGPQYADGFTKSIDNTKVLEISLDDESWVDVYRGDK